MLLKGVIDCPDLPLNVSRSALQNDGFVKKISEYITKKVADKLIGMCKTEKENYEKYWDDISPFIKYGCLKDTKFCDKMNVISSLRISMTSIRHFRNFSFLLRTKRKTTKRRPKMQRRKNPSQTMQKRKKKSRNAARSTM